MPAPAPGLEELLSQIATGMHPLSTLLGKAGAAGGGLEGLDAALYALITWFLGSRESEALRKLGLIVAALLAALSLLELSLTR